MTGQPTYTYAVARTFHSGQIAGLRGLDRAPVRLIGHRDIVAVVSTLPGTAADAPALRTRLESLDELEILARAHHAVVTAVAAHAATLPFRIATVHHGDQRIATVLCDRYDHFSAALERLDGRVELGVKVYATTPDQRRREWDARDSAWHHATAVATHIQALLDALAIDRRHHRPQDAWPSTVPGENVLNLAYLVDRARADQFSARARSAASAASGVRVEVTGPWAPYSFAPLESA